MQGVSFTFVDGESLVDPMVQTLHCKMLDFEETAYFLSIKIQPCNMNNLVLFLPRPSPCRVASRSEQVRAGRARCVNV